MMVLPSQSVYQSPRYTSYNVLMITRTLVLAMVLAITLAVTTPALGSHSEEHQFEHGGGVFVTDNGLVQKMDVAAGNCRDLGTNDFPRGMYSESDLEKIVSACEKKGFPVNVERHTPLSKTGGPPLILVPITLLVVGGLLIRKSAAL
jgi:hypothetical protein